MRIFARRRRPLFLSTRLAPAPVALYAGVFVLVNATYLLLYWELIDRVGRHNAEIRRIMRMRSVATLVIFSIASLLSLKLPL